MSVSKTLFVVGAGASKEAGLPTGIELTATIAKKVNIRFRLLTEQISGEFEITAALRSHIQDVGGDLNDYLHAGWHIRDAMPQASSIDNFIDHQSDDKITLCGKLAIVRSILEAEQKSLLFFDHRQPDSQLKFENLQETWYGSFMKLLVETCHIEKVGQIFENVSFIVFNYDRCVEHFLYHALRNYYRIQDAKVSIGIEL